MCFNSSTGLYNCQLDEQWFNLHKDILIDALDITPANDNNPFEAPPSSDTIIEYVNTLGYPITLRNVSAMSVNALYQPWRAILSMINMCLTGKTLDVDRLGHLVLQILCVSLYHSTLTLMEGKSLACQYLMLFSLMKSQVYLYYSRYLEHVAEYQRCLDEEHGKAEEEDGYRIPKDERLYIKRDIYAPSPRNDLKLEPVYGDEEADIQRAVELSIKEQAERTQGPARPINAGTQDEGQAGPNIGEQDEGLTNQFLMEKSHDDEPDKSNTKAEVQSMVMPGGKVDKLGNRLYNLEKLNIHTRDLHTVDMKEICNSECLKRLSSLYCLQGLRRKRRDTPRSPPRSPPSQPPPPAGASVAPGTPRASGGSRNLSTLDDLMHDNLTPTNRCNSPSVLDGGVSQDAYRSGRMLSALSISKMKAASYPDFGLELLVLEQIAYHQEYKIAEKDFKNLYPSDFEDLNLLLLQATNTQLNPHNQDGRYKIRFLMDHTIIVSPRSSNLRVNTLNKKLMRFNKNIKFSDGTLTPILETLDYRVKEFKIKRLNLGMNTRFWTEKDVTRSKEFITQ
ncbi:retrovirus-related pol polyprotein from transposon TNT 1-94 [Tanacetum coccineum]